MDDSISRQAAIDVVRKCSVKEVTPAFMLVDKAEVMTELMMLPSAQPEIVRCEDCKHYEWMSNRVPEEQTWHCHCWNADTGKDDYCSYAERKDGEA